MNPLYLLLLLPFWRGDRDWEGGSGFDRNVLLALALSGGGQLLGPTGATGTTTSTSQPTIDPTTLFLLLAMGGDLFGPGPRGPIRRAEEIGEIALALNKLDPKITPHVNINVSA